MPTETVYGLCADALNEAAVQKIFKAKGRPADNPLIVHISDLSQIEDLSYGLPEGALKLTEKFWPGPLTVIVKKKSTVPDITSGGLSTVAIRFPKNPVIKKVMELSGCVIAAPSANISGSPSPTNFKHVKEDMFGRIDAIVDGGDCEIGVESTVVSFVDDTPRILRPGGVTAEQIKEILPDVIIDKGVYSSVKKALSPGMKYKHYAPKAEVYLINAKSSVFCNFVNRENIAALCLKEDEQKLSVPYVSLGEKPEKNLFSALRTLDEKGFKTVAAHAPNLEGVGLAVYNRLIRSCGFKTINLPVIIGLTGPSGAGKTMAANTAEGLGFYHIDCDRFASSIVSSQLEELAAVFGKKIQNGNKLNKKALARIAFSSKENTEALNKITLPAIKAALKEEITKLNKPYILLDGATIFEAGAENLCDAVIAVTADMHLRKERIIKRDGLSEADAMLRLSASKSEDFYKEKTPYVIKNNGDINEFLQNFTNTLKKFMKDIKKDEKDGH